MSAPAVSILVLVEDMFWWAAPRPGVGLGRVSILVLVEDMFW